MASSECYHFTKLKNLYSIRNNGLIPRLDINSKAVGDTKPKVSYSDGKVGAVGLFLEFYRIYTDYKSGRRVPNPDRPEEREVYDAIMNSSSLEDFLGNGVYLLFDGSEIENEGGNRGDGGIYDASTSQIIESSKLRVGLVRDNTTGKVSHSMYDYIQFLMSGLSEDEIGQMEDKMKVAMISYFKEHQSELAKFLHGNFSLKEVDIRSFCKLCSKEIDENIADSKESEEESL